MKKDGNSYSSMIYEYLFFRPEMGLNFYFLGHGLHGLARIRRQNVCILNSFGQS